MAKKLQIREMYSAKQVNPWTRKLEPCMVFKFNTGNKVVRWWDRSWYYKTDGTSLGEKAGRNIIAAMNALIDPLYIVPGGK